MFNLKSPKFTGAPFNIEKLLTSDNKMLGKECYDIGGRYVVFSLCV